jgi:hypothetical protein
MATPRGQAPAARSTQMNGRLKFQLWNERKGYWVTAYCLITMLHENLIMMKAHGFKVRVGSQCR